MDSYQSTSSLQNLVMSGIKAEVLSLDRNDTPWLDFVDGLYSTTVNFYHFTPFYDEFFTLDHDRHKHKVDHPSKNEDGSEGSKDVSDAVVGSFYKARQSCQSQVDSTVKTAILSKALTSFTKQPSPMADVFGDITGIKVGGQILDIDSFSEINKRSIR